MKLSITGGRTITPRSMLDIVQEALKEVVLSDFQLGAANGQMVHVRYELSGEPRWLKVYIFKASPETVCADIQIIPDENLDLFQYE